MEKILQDLENGATILQFSTYQVEQVGNDEWREISNRISTNKTLKILDLSKTTLMDEGAKLIAPHLESHPCLEELILQNCQLSDQGVGILMQHLVKNKSPTIQVIDLGNNPIGDKGAKHIASILKKKTQIIRDLILDACQITDLGVQHLEDGLVRRYCVIRKLSLASNQIGNIGARSLAQVLEEPNTQLTEINLSFNQLIGDEGAAHFARSLDATHASTYLKLHLDGCNLGEESKKKLGKKMSIESLEKLKQLVQLSQYGSECSKFASDREQLNWFISLLDQNEDTEVLKHACVVANNMVQFPYVKQKLENETKLQQNIISLMDAKDDLCKTCAFGILWQFSVDDKSKSKLLSLDQVYKIYQMMNKGTESMQGLSKKYAEAAFKSLKKFAFHEQNQAEKDPNGWKISAKNLTFVPVFHKGVPKSKQNGQMSVHYILQVATKSDTPDHHFCLTLPIPQVLCVSDNSFIVETRQDLPSNKTWEAFFCFKGRTLPQTIQISKEWTKTKVKIPSRTELNHFPICHVDSIPQELCVVFISKTSSPKPSHFWFKPVELEATQTIFTSKSS